MNKAYKIGIFDEEENFISSVKALVDKQCLIYEVFSPYPVHEVLHILKRKTRLPTAAYFIGLSGTLATLGFLVWAAGLNWPIIYGGKPVNSFPSFIVVTIVLTILIVTVGSLFVFSMRSKLFPGRENTIFSNDITDNKFVIVIDSDPDDKASKEAVATMKEFGAIEVLEKEYETVKS